jgi:hypothetical protein
MQNDNSTLSNYISLLANHIRKTSKFKNQTEDWLLGATATNLFFEDIATRIVLEEFYLQGNFNNSLSNSQKIFVAIKEIANSSKLYIDKLVSLSWALEDLLKIVVVV